MHQHDKHGCSGVARVFSLLLAIPQALKPHNFRLIETTVLVVGASECKSCAPGDLAAQGYGHYPGMHRLRVHHSWVVSRRVQIFLPADVIYRQIFRAFSVTWAAAFPGERLFVEGQSQKTLVFLINVSRSVLCIIVYSITICRSVAWPPNLGGYNSRC